MSKMGQIHAIVTDNVKSDKVKRAELRDYFEIGLKLRKGATRDSVKFFMEAAQELDEDVERDTSPVNVTLPNASKEKENE